MQQDYQNQQAELQGMLDKKKATAGNYEAQLSDAKAKAKEYQSLIQQQNDQLKKNENGRRQRRQPPPSRTITRARERAAAQVPEAVQVPAVVPSLPHPEAEWEARSQTLHYSSLAAPMCWAGQA